jgi:chemotaxis protein MotB
VEFGEKQPIIIIKKKGRHHAHHGGAWKVAFADFVTAMMAFFLVMWLVGSQSDEVKSAIGSYFRDPLGFKEVTGRGMMQSARSAIDPVEAGPDDEIDPKHSEQLVERRLASAGDEVRAAIYEMPGLSEFGDQVDIEVVEEGLRVELLEADEPTFFSSGNATVSAQGTRTLAAIARIIGPLGYPIAIEGHTDAQALNRPFYSNWELSADRANSARRILENSGVDPKNVASVRAFAATRPRLPKSPNDPRNRRVAIVVKNPAREILEEGIDLSDRMKVAIRDAKAARSAR